MLTLPERLPGPLWAWYALIGAALVLAAHVPVWVHGARALGEPEPYLLTPAALDLYALAFIAALRRVAGSAFEQFRPALGGDPERQAELRRELVSVPDRPALITIVLLLVLINVPFFSDPNNAAFAPDPIVNAVSVALWQVAIILGGITIALAIHQLRMVSRLHAAATHVDVFEQRPITAFSRLTAATAVGLLVVAMVMVAPSDRPAATSLVSGALLIVVAVAFFVLPLGGMHGRLVSERARLLAGSHARLRVTLDRIHAMVDADDTSRADQLQKTLDSLLAERDVLMKLPTWPWSAGTFRGIASAVVLPVALWLVFRILERVV